MLARSSLESSQTLCRGRALSRARAAGAAIGLLAFVSFMQSPKAAEPGRDYSAVTDARLVSPEPRNWLMYRRTYDSWGYSPLDKINARNVQELVPVWSASTGTAEGHQSPPIVNDGTMFITTPFNQVLAFDAASGELLWRYQRRMPPDIRMGHPTNRGVALYGDKLYMATSDAKVVALDARTGRVVWDKAVEDYNGGYYMTMAPLAARGKIMVGVSGGERGIRGFVVALDAESGKEVWKTYTIPGPGEPGHDSWPGDSWKTGGAPVWVTGSFDPALGLTYWGTGNPGPWTGDRRPGDNLYTSSVLALDVETGKLRGYHQYHWNDSWDWDEVSRAALDRRAARRPHGSRPSASRARRLPLVPRARRVRHLVRRGEAVREAERVHEHRSEDRSPDLRRVAQAGRWQEREVLPVSLGRERLAAGRIQSEDRAALHSRERQPLQRDGRRRLRISPRSTVHGGPDERLHRRGRRDAHRRAASVEREDAERAWTHEYASPNWGPVLATAGGVVFEGGTTTATSTRSTRRQASSSGSTARTPGSPACRRRSRLAACSTSPCSRAGASTRRACSAGSTRPAARTPWYRRAGWSGCSRCTRADPGCERAASVRVRASVSARKSPRQCFPVREQRRRAVLEREPRDHADHASD